MNIITRVKELNEEQKQRENHKLLNEIDDTEESSIADLTSDEFKEMENLKAKR